MNVVKTACRISTLVLTVASLAIYSVASAEERSESFDHDPQWDGRNNRTQLFDARPVVQDFGFSPTNHARGAAVGELGGFITRLLNLRTMLVIQPLWLCDDVGRW